MSEKLSRFMQGINTGVEEREPHEREAYLNGMLSGAVRRKVENGVSGNERGYHDWLSAELFLRLKLSAIREVRLLAERQKVSA